jgi:hypothetical protein
MRLPWPVLLVYAVVKYWFVTIPVAVTLALAAWYGAPWLGGLRWVLIAVSVVLALPFPMAAGVVIYQTFDATRFWRTLKVAETIAGLPVPAGSKVHYADKKYSTVVSIELPHSTEIRGMRLRSTLRPWERQGDAVKIWGGILAEDQHLDGLPCRAGPYAHDKSGGIIFDDAGIIYRCTLPAEHELLGLKLPSYTTVRRGNEENPWCLLLPAATGVYLPALATMAPGGTTLYVANDGRLVRIGSGHGQTIVVRGVPLNSKMVELQGEIVASEPIAVAGEMRPAGTKVRINLATGEVLVAGE